MDARRTVFFAAACFSASCFAARSAALLFVRGAMVGAEMLLGRGFGFAGVGGLLTALLVDLLSSIPLAVGLDDMEAERVRPPARGVADGGRAPL